MPCPLYRVDRRCSCDAVADEVVPTLHERERFCGAQEYAHCPTLRAMLRLHRRLSEHEYMSLWLPPAPPPPVKAR